MKRVLPLIVVTLFLAGIFIVPVGVTNTPARLQETSLLNDFTLEKQDETSWIPTDKMVRIALYNETNTTTPSYTSGTLKANYSVIYDLLTNFGYEVARLTVQDISNHELNTVNFDVVILADTCPRENITDLVREFWLGGGGILSFDSAIGYLGYAGILPREGLGVDDGRGTYWEYRDNFKGNVSARHPITQDYSLTDQLLYDDITNYAQFDKTALDVTTIASDIEYLVMDKDNSDWYQVVAVDSTDMGGKVVQMGIPIDPWAEDWENMIIDAVEWLVPRPKARIAYDLTHKPHYGVDVWDSDYYVYSTQYTTYRTDLVSRHYTFDKLYPSIDGNLTADRLAPYDFLIVCESALDFTTAEISAVQTWVNNGGGLLALNDAPFQPNDVLFLNNLTMPFGLFTNSTNIGSVDPAILSENHPTTEACTSLDFGSSGAINVTGDAYEIWNDGAGNIILAASEFGNGRVILAADRLWLGNADILQNSNRQYGWNMANWLTAGTTEVLLYTDEPTSTNNYRTPVVDALNDLGLNFYLTFDETYLNLSLQVQSWEMVIIDNPWSDIDEALDALYDHVEGGGRFLMSGYQVDTFPDDPLWALLGFQFIHESHDSIPLYIWSEDHPVFNTPFDYSVGNFTPTHDYGDEGDILGVFPNGTAIAGNSSSYNVNHTMMVLGNSARTLYNGYAIDQFMGDLDDSTYPDNYELWLNEIAFIMRPTIDSPSDATIELGVSGETIEWNPASYNPWTYSIERETVEVESGTWNGDAISYEIDESSPGVYTFEITVHDGAGYSASDIVVITVEDTTAPTITFNPDNMEFEEGTTGHELNWTFEDLEPDTYVIEVNGTTEASGSWTSGVNVTLLVDDLSLDVGVYNVTIIAFDDSGNSVTDEVIVTVLEEETTSTDTTTSETDTTTETTTDTGTTTPPPDGDYTLILILAGVAAVVVIIVVIMMRKKS